MPGNECYNDSPVSAASSKITTDKSDDQKAVEAPKAAIEAAASHTMTQATANTEATIQAELGSIGRNRFTPGLQSDGQLERQRPTGLCHRLRRGPRDLWHWPARPPKTSRPATSPPTAWAASEGIVSGTTATTFAPDAVITREQMAAIMQRYAAKLGYTLPVARIAETFADAEQISDDAKSAVEIMQQAGVMNGKPVTGWNAERRLTGNNAQIT